MEVERAGSSHEAVFKMVDQTSARILERLVPGQAHTELDIAASLTGNPEALRAYQEGRSYWDRAMVPAAIGAFQRAIQLDPQFAMAYYSLTLCLLWSDTPAARQTIDRAARFSGRLPRQQKLLIQAAQLRLQGRMQDAEQVAQAAVREFPLEIEPRMELAWILAWDFRYADTLPVYQEIVRLDDQQAYAHLNAAYFWAFEGDFPQAQAALDRYAALLPPNDPNVVDARGDLLVLNGRYEEAFAAYRSEQELTPTFCTASWFWGCADKIALSLLYQGKYSLAEATALSGYKTGEAKRQAVAAEVLGDIEVGRGRLDRAVDRYEEAARIFADHKIEPSRPILLKAAQIYFEQQQPQAALTLALGDASLSAAGVRGAAYLLLKDTAAAEKEFADLRVALMPLLGDFWAEKRIELHRLLAASYAGRSQEVVASCPQVGGLHYQISALEAGKAYLNVGMLPEAERHLRFAIQIQRLWTYPNLLPSFLSYTLAHFYLGKLLEQTGRKAEAINAYQEFLGHFEKPPSKLPQIAEARAALIRLGAR